LRSALVRSLYKAALKEGGRVAGFKFRKRIFDLIIIIGLIASSAALVMYPKQSIAAAANGLSLCANVIIPSLFPFFVLSALVVNLGYTRYFGRVLEPVMRPLFNVGGVCSTAFVLGFIGGYPVGAKTVIALYEKGNCTKTEAERLLSFCNNSGPAFIFGVVGAGVFASSAAGVLLYLAHTAASVCVGLIFRNWGKKEDKKSGGRLPQTPAMRFMPAFTDAVKSSFQSTLNICGFVIFFTVVIRLLNLSGLIPLLSGGIGALFAPFGFDKAWAERLLTGLIELSSGVASLRGASAELNRSMATAAFMLGWAGLSIHAQVLSFISDSGLSVKTYFFGKLLHAFLSALFTTVLARVFVFSLPTGAYLAQQVKAMASLSFGTALMLSCLSALLLLILFVISARRYAVRRGKVRKNPLR
jgi:sporulation integral membrane protein YlbJ